MAKVNWKQSNLIWLNSPKGVVNNKLEHKKSIKKTIAVNSNLEFKSNRIKINSTQKPVKIVSKLLESIFPPRREKDIHFGQFQNENLIIAEPISNLKLPSLDYTFEQRDWEIDQSSV